MPCVVRTTRRGYLAYRLRWQGLPGYEAQERTGVKDTAANRKKLEARARVISDEMKGGTFHYLRWFPNGSKAPQLRSEGVLSTTIADYAERTWLPRKQPPVVRLSTEKTYRKHLRNHIVPAFGERTLADVTLTTLEDFRATLVRKKSGKGLKAKTARDVIDGTFRALYRDARKEGLATGDPFALLDWPRKVEPEPDPFDEAERDKLLDYFRRKDRFWHAYVFTHFWTGLRPGEANGLRRQALDLKHGKLSVLVSRSYGEDNAPKTERSKRTITLLPDVVRVLRETPRSAVPRPDDFVFTTPQGCPVDLDRFVDQHWHRALSATGVRPRKFYATRATFISAALTRGANLKWLADYCGTSVEMIERHYGRFMQADAGQLALIAGEGDGGSSSVLINRDRVPISRVKPGKSGPSRVSGQARKSRTNR